jgi:hypothetical protein
MNTLQSALLAFALTLPAHGFAEASADVAAIVERAASHRVLLIGEIHGTAETPAAVADLAQQMATVENPLIVGLEIWRGEQAAIDRFLGSAGTYEDRAQLLASEFWTRDYQDGRSSEAMVELLDRLRALALKAPVSVVAFDADPSADPDGAARDQAMAERLAEALDAEPEARALVLAGNFHTRVQASAPWDPEHRFMGHRLIDYQPYSLEIMGIGGSAWICTGAETDSCKARDLPENTLQPGLTLGDEIGERGHHGVWWLPAVTASRPAVAPAGTGFPAFP